VSRVTVSLTCLDHDVGVIDGWSIFRGPTGMPSMRGKKSSPPFREALSCLGLLGCHYKTVSICRLITVHSLDGTSWSERERRYLRATTRRGPPVARRVHGISPSQCYFLQFPCSQISIARQSFPFRRATRRAVRRSFTEQPTHRMIVVINSLAIPRRSQPSMHLVPYSFEAFLM
jgi:hypothetical protein